MIEHVAAVRGRTVTWDDRRVVQHGMGADRVVLDLDAEWDACDRIQVALACASLEKPVRVIPEGRAFLLPAQMLLVPGQLRMQVIGYEGDSVRLMTEREASPLVVVESGAYDGAVPPEPDQPDLWAKLMADVEAATKAASGAAGAATQAAQAAEAAAKSATDAAAKAESAASSTMEGELRRVRAEASRVEAERSRAAAESAREGAEDKRAASESARTKAETARDAAEKERETAELGRAAATAEAVRKAADAAAKADEAAATAAAGEQGRVTAEHGRAEAEKARAAAEADRAKRADAAIAAAGEAAASAEAAAASATSAANKAESAVAQLPIPSGNVLKGEAESTFINLHDSWKAPILKGKVLGQSNQITTKGINLVNHANPLGASGNVPFRGEKLKNGFVIGSLPDTKNDNRIATMKVLGGIKAGDTIVVSCNYRKLSGDIEIPSFYLSDAPQEYGILINRPFTVKNNHSLIGVYIDADSNSKIEITDFQLIKSSQPLPYEPYTGGKPSPSPDYPQEITNLTKAELVVAGRNLFSAQIDIRSGNTNEPIYLSKGTYTISVKNEVEWWKKTANDNNIYIHTFKENEFLTGVAFQNLVLGQRSYGTFNVNKNCEARFFTYGSWDNNAVTEIQLEAASTATTYEPHQSKSTPIDLQGNELCSVKEIREWSSNPPEYKDELVIDSEGNVNLVKRVFSAHIDKLESDTLGTTAQFQYFSYAPNTVRPIDGSLTICSNRFGKIGREPWCFYIAGGSNAAIFFTFPVGTFKDKVALNEWLKSNPIDVNYLGVEPQTIPLGKVELPALPESTSNIWNNGNIPANVYIQYLKDVNIAFSDLESKLTQAVVAAAANL